MIVWLWILLLLLLQSALQPLWVLACSTIVEYSQQEGFYRVLLPAARHTPNKVSPRLKRRERTPLAEGGTMGQKLPRILPKMATSTSPLGSFTCRILTTWDRRLYFRSEGRRTEEFFARKIRRLRPVPEARTFTSRPPKPLSGVTILNVIKVWRCNECVSKSKFTWRIVALSTKPN